MVLKYALSESREIGVGIPGDSPEMRKIPQEIREKVGFNGGFEQNVTFLKNTCNRH